MADQFTRAQRSAVMSRVRGRDTGPERLIRQLLRSQGYRFTLYSRRLPGSPDIVLLKHRKAIFVHGCFWHGHAGCARGARPTTNVRFWNRKITGNITRDARVKRALRKLGWESLVIWQCRMKDRKQLTHRLTRFMQRKATHGR